MNPQVIKGQSYTYNNPDQRASGWSSANPVWKAPIMGFRTFRVAKVERP